MSTVAVVGLGYVGLPLAVEFGKIHDTIGFDLSAEKVRSYQNFIDPTGEMSSEALRAATKLKTTTDPAALAAADYIIVAVPTPIDNARLPDFSPLVGASRTVGQNMKKGAIVIYESTVYPGATEEDCVPVLEQHSGMSWKQDFSVGYSPERINPGDKEHTLTRIVKVVSGDDAADPRRCRQALRVRLSRPGCIAPPASRGRGRQGHREHTTRSEHRAHERAGADFQQARHRHSRGPGGRRHQVELPAVPPGLVGGHCIGVDPYYLTHKAEMIGYHSEVILAGRRINDNMGKFIAEQTVKQMIASGSAIKAPSGTVLGLTFKEDVPGPAQFTRHRRNQRTRLSYGLNVQVHDPVPAAATKRGKSTASSWSPGISYRWPMPSSRQCPTRNS